MAAHERPLTIAFAAVVAVSLVLRVALVAHAPGDFDEFQALHGAWNVTQKLLPYRDFWENHGPATYYLLAPIFIGGREGESVFFIGRAIAALCGVGALALTYRIARLFVRRPAASAAVALLAWTPIFAIKTIETRPDAFYLLLWLGAVLAYLARPDGRRAALAGVLVGCGFWFTPKALFGLTALVAAVLVAGATQRSLRRGLGHAVAVGLGFLLPVALLALLFAALGVLSPLVRWMILFNFTVPHLRTLRVLGEALLPSMLTLVAFGAAGWVASFLRPVDGRRVALAVLAAVVTVIYVFVMPAPYAHNALPALPLLCVLGVTVVDGSRSRPRGAFLWILLVAGAIALPVGSFVFGRRPWERDPLLQVQLTLGAEVRRRLGPEDSYFGPTAYPITRRSAWFFNVIVDEVADALAKGSYPPPDIPTVVATLRRLDCPLVVSGMNFIRARTPDLGALLAERYRVVYEVHLDLVRYRILVAPGGCGATAAPP